MGIIKSSIDRKKHHITRDIDWLPVIKFHKEIVKRFQENFFTLPAQERKSRRWSSLLHFSTNSLDGPWTI